MGRLVMTEDRGREGNILDDLGIAGSLCLVIGIL